MTSRAHSPHCHYDVILIVMSYTTELAMPTITDVQADRCRDTLPRLIYIYIHKDLQL